MPCPSVARERLDGDICSWLACWGQNASRVAVALYSYHYASGSNNKRGHLDGTEILLRSRRSGTPQVWCPVVGTSQAADVSALSDLELQTCDVGGLRVRNDVRCCVAGDSPVRRC